MLYRQTHGCIYWFKSSKFIIKAVVPDLKFQIDVVHIVRWLRWFLQVAPSSPRWETWAECAPRLFSFFLSIVCYRRACCWFLMLHIVISKIKARQPKVLGGKKPKPDKRPCSTFSIDTRRVVQSQRTSLDGHSLAKHQALLGRVRRDERELDRPGFVAKNLWQYLFVWTDQRRCKFVV